MGFGVYGKSNWNKRGTGGNGVKFEDIARDVYRGFQGKSNRVVCSQPNGIYGTNGTTEGIYTRRKNRSVHDKIWRKRPRVSDFSGRVKFSSSVLSRIQHSSEFLEDLIETCTNPIADAMMYRYIYFRKQYLFAVLTILSINTIHHSIQFINYL